MTGIFATRVFSTEVVINRPRNIVGWSHLNQYQHRLVLSRFCRSMNQLITSKRDYRFTGDEYEHRPSWGRGYTFPYPFNILHHWCIVYTLSNTIIQIRQNSLYIDDILDISTKPTLLWSDIISTIVWAKCYISSTIIGRVCLYGYVIYSSADAHC